MDSYFKNISIGIAALSVAYYFINQSGIGTYQISAPLQLNTKTGELLMTSDEADIEASLKILLGTAIGERFLHPKYGLDLHDLLFLETSIPTETKIKLKNLLGGSPGLVVMGGDSCSKGRGFESQCNILDRHFFTLTCCKFLLMFV